MHKFSFLPLLALLAGACSEAAPTAPITVRVVKDTEVEWQMLNPLRGDKSPRAGTLWGDRGAPVPCGFLVKFIDGFSSPPHIHPVTYRGVVISGLVHNDDPKAEKEWLPPGTFWTQPAGEVHITAAQGATNVAYIEIEKGPYLVKPASDAFEPPETPIKLAPAEMSWNSTKPRQPAIALLPGNPGNAELTRMMVRLPPKLALTMQGDKNEFHVVVITGRVEHEVEGHTAPTTLEPGSYFGSTGPAVHRLRATDAETYLYVRAKSTSLALKRR
ncbi:MAG: DUF4437 domain-containing protein [Planctomycetota bacterium]